MKKTFKTLAAFLFLLALITSIRPIQPPVGNDTEPGISVCGDDDIDVPEAITTE